MFFDSILIGTNEMRAVGGRALRSYEYKHEYAPGASPARLLIDLHNNSRIFTPVSLRRSMYADRCRWVWRVRGNVIRRTASEQRSLLHLMLQKMHGTTRSDCSLQIYR